MLGNHSPLLTQATVAALALLTGTIVPKLTHMDVSYAVGGDPCSPCRLIGIVSPAAGLILGGMAVGAAWCSTRRQPL